MFLKLLIINLLTLVRVIGTIVLIPVYKIYGGIVAGIMSLICYFTDSVDGFLARKWHASTFFGALFDSFADKLFTIINFIVLYLITPYAIIPIFFEILIIIVQIIKYKKNINVQSNIIGKLKVWVLAITVVLLFMINDINNITIINNSLKNYIINFPTTKLYLYLLIPAIIMEILTFLSYIIEIFISKKKVISENIETFDEENLDLTFYEKFKHIWLNPEFYELHKNDPNLKKVIQIKR